MTQANRLTEDELIAYFEGALAADVVADVSARLVDDADARALLASWAAQNEALGVLYPAPPGDAVPQAMADMIARARADGMPMERGRGGWRVAASVAILAIGLAGGWFARDLALPAVPSQTVAIAALQAHQTFVGEVKHPVEVLASDAAHMNTWMSKRLGRDMQPPDLAASGFALLGGRIVPSATGPAGLYMYENTQGQRITLYILPDTAAGSQSFQFRQDGATQSFFWLDDNLSCAVVGDIPRDALRAIAVAAYDQLI
jgi:anti-sigma factor RsiW